MSVVSRVACEQDHDARSVVFLVSPGAGYASAANRLAPVRQRLDERGYRVVVSETPTDFAHVTQQMHDAGELRAVLSAGGDGTARLAADLAPGNSPILPLPLGTENLLPKYVRQTSQADDVLATLDTGVLVDIDQGWANGNSFLLMVSVGFDAHVVRTVHQRRRGHISKWSYYQSIFSSLRAYEFPIIRYRAFSGGELAGEGRCGWFFVMNLPCYAQGIGILPQANGGDGKMDMCALGKGSLLSGISYFCDILRGKHQQRDDVTIIRGDRFELESDAAGIPVQMDGDGAGELPLELTIETKGVRLLVKRSEVKRLGFEPS